MQPSKILAHFRSSALALLLTQPSACHKLQPQGGNPTMALLRDGSQKVCVAQDVLDALRAQIVPKPGELDTNVAIETRNKAAAAVSVDFEQTSLQSFDKDVTKATCNTMAALRSFNGSKTDTFRISYAVSPAADDAASFVVTADVSAARAFAEYLTGDEINEVVAKGYTAQRDREAAESRRQLLATVNSQWLIGAWIATNQPPAGCGDGHAIWFAQGGVLEGALGNGRWALTSNELHLVGIGGPKRFDVTGTIVHADAVSFTITNGSEDLSFRRCTRAETETLPPPTEGEETEG